VVFRRSRREEQQGYRLEPGYGTPGPDWDRYRDSGEPDELDEDDSGYEPQLADADVTGSGPWDGAEPYPRGNRVDFGSLLVPVRQGMEIRINLADAVTGVSVDIVSGDMLRGGSFLQLQAFAAPKRSGLWDEVRLEIIAEVAKAGGRSEEARGPYGPELRAVVAAGGASGQQFEQQRFIGVDGPRWFLRGVIRGLAASHPEQARPLEELFADVVVVRGDDPLPPRELLPLHLPEDARRALAEQLEEEAGPASGGPFSGGPGFAESR
jgi:hypothetical protein